MSTGELLIAQLLTKNNFIFCQEKSFKNLREGKFKYDFYITGAPGKSNLIFPILLEFDGKQHFIQVKRYQQTRLDLNKQKGYDRRKNNFALAHNIPLYRIPYWEANNIKTIDDLFNNNFLVKTQYHNDIIWKEFLERGGNPNV